MRTTLNNIPKIEYNAVFNPSNVLNNSESINTEIIKPEGYTPWYRPVTESITNEETIIEDPKSITLPDYSKEKETIEETLSDLSIDDITRKRFRFGTFGSNDYKHWCSAGTYDLATKLLGLKTNGKFGNGGRRIANDSNFKAIETIDVNGNYQPHSGDIAVFNGDKQHAAIYIKDKYGNGSWFSDTKQDKLNPYTNWKGTATIYRQV